MSNPTALVVGGTSGIGLATARRLQTIGAHVHVVGRSEARLASVSGTDPELIGHQGDGSDREQMTGVIEAIGTFDWLIVTLSGSEGPGPLAELDLDMLRRAFDAKFWGQITTIQAALQPAKCQRNDRATPRHDMVSGPGERPRVATTPARMASSFGEAA